jgi:hypothetical protein
MRGDIPSPNLMENIVRGSQKNYKIDLLASFFAEITILKLAYRSSLSTAQPWSCAEQSLET